jgi:hypothetical protein
MPNYYTETGEKVRNPEAYALTGAPMYKTKYGDSTDINGVTTIYKMNLKNGKKYIGKTTDVDRRMNQHFSGNGSKVTKKFKPISGEIIDVVHGFFSDEVEHEYTEEYIEKHGYNNVRGGYYTNSKTLKYEKKQKKKVITCYKCGKTGHYANRCFSKQSKSLNFF